MEDYLQNANTKFNKYQSTLEEIDFYNLPDEVREQFLDYITSIVFIRNLISPNRPYVQDLPKDEAGRAIIDFSNPPLYEDISAFIPTASLFKEQGILNPYKPNKNPQSDYYKWLGRDIYRSWNGRLDKKTGMWIPGEMYWYLNYCMMTQTVTDKNGVKIKNTTVPEFWEGQWWRFLGWYKARIENVNFAEIAGRRKGKSFSAAGKACRDFFIGESESHRTNNHDLFVADNLQYLTAGGVLNKLDSMINFVMENTEICNDRYGNIDKMLWISGYYDLESKSRKGSLNEIIGMTIADDPDKPRGKEAGFVYFEEFGNFGKLQKHMILQNTVLKKVKTLQEL